MEAAQDRSLMIGFTLQYIDSPAYLVHMWDVMSSELPVKDFVSSAGDGLLFGAVVGYAETYENCCCSCGFVCSRSSYD